MTGERLNPTEGRKELTPFHDTSLQVLREMIMDPQEEELWKRIRFTYNERRQQVWLVEHDDPNRKDGRWRGLAGALGHCYDTGHTSNEEYVRELTQLHLERGMVADIDEDFRDQLLSAAEQVAGESEDFKWNPSLGRKFTDVLTRDSITPEELRQDFKRNLVGYWINTYARGYDGDPW